ncbi:MAG: hypothetical protein ACLUE1_06785 [Adlercreutzia equolifaciens]
MAVMEEAVEEVTAPEEVNLVELMNACARSYGMLARLFREEVDLPTLRVSCRRCAFPRPRATLRWMRATTSCTPT